MKEPKELAIVKELIDSVDLVIELVDARFFYDSRLYELEKYVEDKGKLLLIVVNKVDLIGKEDYLKLKKEVEKVAREERIYVDFVSVRERKGISKLRSIIKRLARVVEEKWRREGKSFSKVRCCIIGLPNAGKSSVINGLRGKHSARTSVKPGFTRGYQYLRLSKKVLLIDTPGVYLPELPPEHLVFLNALDLDKVKDIESSAYFVYNLIKEKAREEIERVYGFNGNTEEFFEKLAIENKFFSKGKELDLIRAYKKFLQDWYGGKIRVCFLKPVVRKEEEKQGEKSKEKQEKSKLNKKVLVFDTNFLIYYAKEGNIEDIEDLIKTYLCIIIDKSLDEIKNLIRGKYKQRVTLLLEFLEQNLRQGEIEIEKSRDYEDVDGAILRLVKEKDIDAVATYDRELIRKIKKINARVKIVY